MAKAFSFNELLSSFLGDSPSNNKDISNLTKQLKKELKDILLEIELSSARIDKILKERQKILEKGDIASISTRKKLEELDAELEKFTNSISENQKEISFAITEAGKAAGATKEELDEVSKAFNVTSDSVEHIPSMLEGLSSGFKTSSKSLSELTSIIEGGFVAALGYAASVVVDLNDKLIRFAREQSGTVNARILGFNQYGANKFGGSLNTIASTNGLSTDEFLKSFEAFNDGSIIGMGDTLKDNAVALQEFGVESAKIAKLYGVNQSSLSNLSKVMVTEYGRSVNDVTQELKIGAGIAAQAGINVGRFFDTMNQIAESGIFIKGGLDGLRDAAFALTKLGLSANSLAEVNKQYETFTNLVDIQQKSLAIGLSKFSNIQSQAFAKSNVGDDVGASRLRISAAAQDIKNLGRVDPFGKIDNQGKRMLTDAGISPDEQRAIQRLIKQSNELGESIENVINENLEYSKLQKKRRMEQEELTITEKFNKLAGQLESVFIDPLVQVLSPLFDIFINLTSSIASFLSGPMKLIGFGFGILGNALSKIAFTISKVSDGFEKFWTGITKFIGLNSENGTKLLESISGVLSSILALLIAWKAVSQGEKIIDSISGSLQNTKLGRLRTIGQAGKLGRLGGFGKAAQRAFDSGTGQTLMSGAGKLGKFAKIGLKGAGIGSLIGLAAEGAGTVIGGKTGETISKVGSIGGSVAMGATIGSIIPVVGTAIGGAIGGLAGVWSEYGDEISSFAEKNKDAILNTTKYLKFLPGIGGGIAGLLEFFLDDKKDEENKKSAKISTSAYTNAEETTKNLMNTRRIENRRADVENQMSAARSQGINITVKNDMISAGANLKAQGT